MAKGFANAVQDAALAKIATCVTLTFCSAVPANYAGIAAVALASATLTAGDGNGDYVIAAEGTGRKLTVGAQTGMTPGDDGHVVCWTLDDGTTLLAWGEVDEQEVTTLQTWDSPAIVIVVPDPV